MVARWLKAGVVEQVRLHRTEEGAPQGGVMKMLLGGSSGPGPVVRRSGTGPFWRTKTGRLFCAMGCEPVVCLWPPLRLAWIEL